MSGSSVPDPLRCADVSFDAKQRALTVKGNRTMLDARSALIFQALSDRFGDVVSKDTLLEAAWPGRLVHENSLAKAISRLRNALSGSGLAINAAYGFGYSLVPASDEEGAAVATDRPSSSDIPPQQQHRSRKPAWMTLLALPLCAALTLVLLWPADRLENLAAAPIQVNDAPDALATILWVDDHPSNNRKLVSTFKQRRIAVHLAESTEDALKLLRMNDYQLVLSDLGRGDDRLAGLKLAALMKQQGLTKPVIIYTVRPKEPAGQLAQKQMVRDAGADLAVTPAKVQVLVLDRLAAMLGQPSA